MSAEIQQSYNTETYVTVIVLVVVAAGRYSVASMLQVAAATKSIRYSVIVELATCRFSTIPAPAVAAASRFMTAGLGPQEP